MTKIFLARFFGFQSDNRKSKIYDDPFGCAQDRLRRTLKNTKLVAGIVALVVAFVGSAGWVGGQPAKIPRIGFLVASSRAVNAAREDAFRQGLRELAYVEGQNFTIEWRVAEGKLDRLSTLAAELVGLKVDVIVTAGPADTRAAKEATSTIPIVKGTSRNSTYLGRQT